MKKLLSILSLLLILGCSKSTSDEITPANNPIIQAYNKITGDDFVGSWVYYLTRSDKSSAYRKLMVTKVDNDYFIESKTTMMNGDWVDDFQLPSQKLVDFVTYEEAEYYRKQPNFTLTDSYRNKKQLYIKIETSSRYLEFNGNKYYKE